MDESETQTQATPKPRRGRPRRKPTSAAASRPAPDDTQESAPQVAREEMRAPLRGESSRQEADRIAREVLEKNRGVDPDFHDDFALPPGVMPPDGWEYQWKRRMVGGLEDPSYIRELERQGWRAVPARRHLDMVGPGHHEIIERKGMILMECPKLLTDTSRAREYKKAEDRIRINEQRLGQTPSNQLPRTGNRGVNSPPVLRTEYTAPTPGVPIRQGSIPVPNE